MRKSVSCRVAGGIVCFIGLSFVTGGTAFASDESDSTASAAQQIVFAVNQWRADRANFCDTWAGVVKTWKSSKSPELVKQYSVTSGLYGSASQKLRIWITNRTKLLSGKVSKDSANTDDVAHSIMTFVEHVRKYAPTGLPRPNLVAMDHQLFTDLQWLDQSLQAYVLGDTVKVQQTAILLDSCNLKSLDEAPTSSPTLAEYRTLNSNTMYALKQLAAGKSVSKNLDGVLSAKVAYANHLFGVKSADTRNSYVQMERALAATGRSEKVSQIDALSRERWTGGW
jgi:hypothetical protein